MEIKDLVLLMIIPILLVSLVVYTGNNPITGYVAAEPSGNNVIGTYSIMPSFRAKIDYNMQKDYQYLNNKLKEIIDKCKAGNNIEECINQHLYDENLDWKCPESSSDILDDFVDKLNECKNLEDENVVCRFSLPKNEKINGESSQRNFEIKLTSENYPKVDAEMTEGKKTYRASFDLGSLFYTDFDNRDKESQIADSVILKLNYKEGIPTVNKFVAVKDSNEKELSKIILVYKSKNIVKFIDNAYEPPFRSSDPSGKTGLPRIIDLPKTKGMNFCAITGSKVYAYDESDGAVKLRNIVYKFAIKFSNPVPKPIENLEIKDAINAENSVILIWEKGKESDVKSYSLYYATKPFDKIKTNDIKSDKEIKKISVSIENPVEIENIDLNTCNFDPVGESCKFGIYNKKLEKNKLYYWKSQDKFIYMIGDADDDVKFNFAVTAVNTDEEEIDNEQIEGNTYILSPGKNYREFASKDDLAPGKISNLQAQSIEAGKLKLTWSKPQKNIDGSVSDDVVAFNIYYKKPNLVLPPKIDVTSPFGIRKRITASDSKCDGIELNCEYTLSNLENGQLYILAVTALDENSNDGVEKFAAELDVFPVQVQ